MLVIGLHALIEIDKTKMFEFDVSKDNLKGNSPIWSLDFYTKNDFIFYDFLKPI